MLSYFIPFGSESDPNVANSVHRPTESKNSTLFSKDEKQYCIPYALGMVPI